MGGWRGEILHINLLVRHHYFLPLPMQVKGRMSWNTLDPQKWGRVKTHFKFYYGQYIVECLCETAEEKQHTKQIMLLREFLRKDSSEKNSRSKIITLHLATSFSLSHIASTVLHRKSSKYKVSCYV